MQQPVMAVLGFAYQHEYRKAQLTGVYFDEFTHFSEYQFNYLRTRLRSKSKYPSFMRVSMNPDNEHFVVKWIEPYLDEDGYPIPELACKTRYFLFVDGEVVSGWDKEELNKLYPGKNLRTYTFVPSKLTDNKKLLEINEDYADELAANSQAEKAALLDGCWYYKVDEGSYFNREWLHKTHKVPEGTTCARAWDKASQVPTETYRYPDYTASFKMHKDKEGYYYIVGDYHPFCKDKGSDIYGRFRALPGDRDNLILEQSKADGDECYVILAQDPGQAGKTEYMQSAKNLMSNGFIVKPDPMPVNKSKLKKFEPFSSACMNGFVYIVEDSFPNKATLEHVYKEMELFTGERSSATIKDD